MKKKLSILAVLAATSVILSSGTAVAAAPVAPKVLAKGLLTPLHVSAGYDGSVLVSEEFAGRLVRIARNGARSTVYENAAWDVAGSDRQRGTIYFAVSQGAGPMDPRPLAGRIRSIGADGKHRTFGDLAALEKKENADGKTQYGFRNLPATCAAKLPKDVPVAYKGDVDSHPYGIEVSGRTVYVADAGANSIVSVDVKSGSTKTVAVLPPQPHRITAEQAAALKMPSCIVGHTYRFEPVPTDVTVGPDGWLYVSLLPGGPEDPALGARGSVYKVNPHTGKVKLFADHVMSPTGIETDDDGNVYVASLFGKGVLRISDDDGKQRVLLPAKLAADVDLRGDTLYATVNALPEPMKAPDGRVVSMALTGHRDD
ncbi:ScyD/ScyE family protein [Arthrobacter sp. ISL-28]|uniref:ScyD/ScyE family protein n=1 Tax=Arthrobacter sp. ISL-28 TaxID=2819108 RepID=UPI001BE508CB|nr:ScyD/ScyE family protein [Arthrobacter sp. ISL-28]MBT2520624.1 ScyD/ScyE family protein [Arthrobacter sp. ISL-28]